MGFIAMMCVRDSRTSAIQCVSMCCSVLQCVPVCYSVLQCVAVCCSVLQCVAVCCKSVLMRHVGTLLCVCDVLCCSVLQCVAVRCSALQCVAVRCSVLQCVAVWCRSLLMRYLETLVRQIKCQNSFQNELSFIDMFFLSSHSYLSRVFTLLFMHIVLEKSLLKNYFRIAGTLHFWIHTSNVTLPPWHR